MKILTVGGATRDIFIEHPVQAKEIDNVSCITFPEGKKIEVSDVYYTTGGGATNSAVSFQKLGLNAECFCKIGDDHEGEAIVAELMHHEVSIGRVIKTNLAQTGTSFILPSPIGDRAILVYRGANKLLSSNDIPKELFTKVEQLYITSLSGTAADMLPLLAKKAKELSIPVACNPGTSQLTTRIDTLKEALAYIDILILNCYEANLLLDSIQKNKMSIKKVETQSAPLFSKPLHHYFKTVLSHGPQIAVVTNGADGVYACDGKNIYYHQSLKCKTVSTVGAGDAFGSTFVAYQALNKSIQESMQAGVINAASVLKQIGAKTGLLTLEKIEDLRKKLDPSLFFVHKNI